MSTRAGTHHTEQRELLSMLVFWCQETGGSSLAWRGAARPASALGHQWLSNTQQQAGKRQERAKAHTSLSGLSGHHTRSLSILLFPLQHSASTEGRQIKTAAWAEVAELVWLPSAWLTEPRSRPESWIPEQRSVLATRGQ